MLAIKEGVCFPGCVAGSRQAVESLVKPPSAAPHPQCFFALMPHGRTITALCAVLPVGLQSPTSLCSLCSGPGFLVISGMAALCHLQSHTLQRVLTGQLFPSRSPSRPCCCAEHVAKKAHGKPLHWGLLLGRRPHVPGLAVGINPFVRWRIRADEHGLLMKSLYSRARCSLSMRSQRWQSSAHEVPGISSLLPSHTAVLCPAPHCHRLLGCAAGQGFAARYGPVQRCPGLIPENVAVPFDAR